MFGTRSSARKPASAASESSQPAAGSKRKGSTTTPRPKSKKGKKGDHEKRHQTTIEVSLRKEGAHDGKDVEMKDVDAAKEEKAGEEKPGTDLEARDEIKESETDLKAKEEGIKQNDEAQEKGDEDSNDGANSLAESEAKTDEGLNNQSNEPSNVREFGGHETNADEGINGKSDEPSKPSESSKIETKTHGDLNGESDQPSKATESSESKNKTQEGLNGESDEPSKASASGETEPKDDANSEGKDAKRTDSAVKQLSTSENSTPSSILEKGIIYFFFRGRVGVDEPSNVDEIARSYIVLRPIPYGAKIANGPIGDVGTNRLLALPKKVLPTSGKDRFMIFVEKSSASLEEIKSSLAASDYVTKTAGARHTPPATPIGEGVYAITKTGRESHLAYILSIPSELSEVQRDIGLQERGSFVTTVKNPQYSGPANASLPQDPSYPQEILDEFRSLRWMPLHPKLLDYVNTQILIIGHSSSELDKATQQQPRDEQMEKETPLEEMENLEHEDELRVQHLKGDDSVFVDLGLSSSEYPKVFFLSIKHAQADI